MKTANKVRLHELWNRTSGFFTGYLLPLLLIITIFSIALALSSLAKAEEKGGMYVTKQAMVVVDYYEFREADSMPAMRIKPYLLFTERPVYEYNLEKKIEACRAPVGTPCNSTPANPQPTWAGRPVYPVVVIDTTDCYGETNVCGIKCAGYAYCSLVKEE